MLAKLCRPYLVGVLMLGGCMPYSCSSGTLGKGIPPWEFRTQYAFWDVHKTVTNGTGPTSFPERPDSESGAILNIRLHGFMFHPTDDRRTWNAFQTNDFNRGMETQPSLWATVSLANKLSDKDTVELDPDNPITAPDKPRVNASFFPGDPPLKANAEYPDHEIQYGSKVSVTLKLSALAKEPGPVGVVSGTITVKYDKAGGDPDDAITGEVKSQFQAQVIGERLAECNDSVTLGLGFGTNDACKNLDPKNP